jgi:hypothetical protein
MNYEVLFLKSLVKTIVIETLMLVVAIRWFFKINASTIDLRSIVFSGFICSFATLPYLWFILPAYIHNRTMYVALGEIAVTLLEAIFLCFILKITKYRALILSILANGASLLIGLLIR